MRSYKDAKAMAKSLRAVLAARNVSLSHTECLEIVARQFNFADWNTLSSKLEDDQPAPPGRLMPHPPPAAPACDTFPDEEMPALAIYGSLKSSPIYVVDWRTDILSDPFELAGNGIYRIRLTPRGLRERSRHWYICRSCGSRGSILGVVLTDESGRQLASVNLTTLAHCMGIAIFYGYGVMVQSVPRKAAMFFRERSATAGAKASGSNWAAVINQA